MNIKLYTENGCEEFNEPKLGTFNTSIACDINQYSNSFRNMISPYYMGRDIINIRISNLYSSDRVTTEVDSYLDKYYNLDDTFIYNKLEDKEKVVRLYYRTISKIGIHNKESITEGVIEIRQEYCNKAPMVGNRVITLNNRLNYDFNLDDFTTKTNPVYSDKEGDTPIIIRVIPNTNSFLYFNNVKLESQTDISVNELYKLKHIAPNINQRNETKFNFTIKDSGSNQFSSNLGEVIIINEKKANEPPNQLGVKLITLENRQDYVIKESDILSGNPIYIDPEGDLPSKLKVLEIDNITNLQIGNEFTWQQIKNGEFKFKAIDTDEKTKSTLKYTLSDVGSEEYSDKVGELIFTTEEVIRLVNVDYLVFTYEFSDSVDLDTATQLIYPDVCVSRILGWGAKDVIKPYTHNDNIIRWGGDNMGTGKEQILIDLKEFKRLYDKTYNELKFTSRCFWFGTGEKTGKAFISLQAYRGGTMRLIENTFSFINEGGELAAQFNFGSENITLNSNNQSNVERVEEKVGLGTFTYNLITGDLSRATFTERVKIV